MTDRAYPFNAWVLQPSLKPVEITLVEPYRSFGSPSEYVRCDSGKLYGLSELHATKSDAITAGWVSIERMEADLAKRTANLQKKRAALTRAAAALDAGRMDGEKE